MVTTTVNASQLPDCETNYYLYCPFSYFNKQHLTRISCHIVSHVQYTFSQLLDMVQCSEDELTDGLEQLQACNINGQLLTHSLTHSLPPPPPPCPFLIAAAGCWRVLDLDYKEQVFQDILTLVDAEGWEWTKIPLADCCVKMAQIAPR